MKRPGAAWTDVFIAAVLAVLAGREVLKDLHAAARDRGACGVVLEREARNGHQPGGRGPVEAQSLPPGIHLPRPSVWPMVLGAGLSLLLFGVVTSYAFIALGVVVVVAALAGWIGDLLDAGAD